MKQMFPIFPPGWFRPTEAAVRCHWDTGWEKGPRSRAVEQAEGPRALTWTAKTWVLWPPRLRRRWSTASIRGSKPASWGEQLHATPPCTSGLKPQGMKSFLRGQKQKLQLLIRQNSGYSLNLWDNQQRGIIHQLQREQINKVNIIVTKVWTHCESSLSMSERGRGPESTGPHQGKSIQMELKVQDDPRHAAKAAGGASGQHCQYCPTTHPESWGEPRQT